MPATPVQAWDLQSLDDGGLSFAPDDSLMTRSAARPYPCYCTCCSTTCSCCNQIN